MHLTAINPFQIDRPIKNTDMIALTFYASYELSAIDHIFDQIIHFKSLCHSYALFEVIRHLPDMLGALVCTLRKPSFTYLLPPILLRVP